MAVREFNATKDVAVRSSGASWSSAPREGTGARAHLYAGRLPGRLHRSFIDFAFDFSEVAVISLAELVLHTSEADNDVTPEAKAEVFRVTAEWSEGGHSDWATGDAINPPVATGKSWSHPVNAAPEGETRIDITSLVGMWAPKGVRWVDAGGSKQPGGGVERHGLCLRAKDEQDPGSGYEVWSAEAGVGSRRPHIEITYTPKDQRPDVMTAISPSGEVLPGLPFTGEFSDPDGDRPEKIRIVVRKVSNGNEVWTKNAPFDPLWSVGGGGFWEWSVANPGAATLKGDIDYEWRAKGFDKSDKESDWTTPWKAFRQTGTVPVVTPISPIFNVEYETLVGVEFVMGVETFDGSVPTAIHIQLSSHSDPNWETPEWEETFWVLTPHEIEVGRVSRPYGGVYLGPGGWDWRARAYDSLGRVGDWGNEYETFYLTVGSEVDQDGGGLGPPPNTTGYARVRGPVRVVLRDMGPNRKPGTVKAIIEDPANLGCSAYVNEPGEMYFTLPATHPQASECEPYQRHYAVQQYRNGNWRDIANGILTDFDASADDIVVYGIDYLGFLSLSIDTRFPPGPSVEDLNKSTDDGGARYVKKTIDHIITNQLNRAIDDEDSPLGFFHIGHVDDLSMGGGLTISIYSSFVQRLDFIRGLLDSYRQGTGVRSRLKARKDPSQADRWEFDVRADPGIRRANLRMEYGSLVQGFRVIGFGDTFATRAHGIGREPYSTKLRYTMNPDVGDSNDLTDRYGNIAKAQIWQDIIDENDLNRRVRQLYQESIKVGKRIALGLRVHSLQPWDGFDLTDNIPLNIERGMVDTQAYGSGWWTIWGQEWRVFPDGHDELTLVIRPEEDGEPADPDLLPSKPGPVKDWCVGHGPPTGDMVCACDLYLDIDSGIIYPCPDDPIVPEPWTPAYLLFDDFERTPPGPCWESGGAYDLASFLSGCIIMGITQGYTGGGTSHAINLPDGSGYPGGVISPGDVQGRRLLLFTTNAFNVIATGGPLNAFASPWNNPVSQRRACTHGFFPFNDGHPAIDAGMRWFNPDSLPGFYPATGAVLTGTSANPTSILWIAVLVGGIGGSTYIGPNAVNFDVPTWSSGKPGTGLNKQALYFSVSHNREWNHLDHPGLGVTPEEHDTTASGGTPAIVSGGMGSSFQRIATAAGGELTLDVDIAFSPVNTGAGVPDLNATGYIGSGGAQMLQITRLYAIPEA